MLLEDNLPYFPLRVSRFQGQLDQSNSSLFVGFTWEKWEEEGPRTEGRCVQFSFHPIGKGNMGFVECLLEKLLLIFLD